MKIISWNIAGRIAPWTSLSESDADVALLQEARQPPQELGGRLDAGSTPWNTPGNDAYRDWRTAVVRLSERAQVDWIEVPSLLEASWETFRASRPGTLAVARVSENGAEPLLVVSMYALWEGPERSDGHSSFIYADASVHRLISDLSCLIVNNTRHRVLAAGDLNILYGYGEFGDGYWAGRYRTVFDRMEALGLTFAGPQAPHGRQAYPWPDELPKDSKNVPTYKHGDKPDQATRQLDFVFVSRSLADSVQVRALNDPEEWGPSDHCRLEIEIDLG